jgi:hypothetical protein
MALTKPTVDSATWGNTNTTSPDMVTPGAGLVNTGFLAPPTLPKRGHMNWLLNKLHQGLRYYLSQGIPAWDASENNYGVGSQVMVGAIGYVLKTAPATVGLAPNLDLTHWGLLVPVQPGTLLRRSRLTVGPSLAKYSADVRFASVKMVGGGAGGNGVQAFGVSATGGGGAAGGYAEFDTTTIPATWLFSIGVGGAGGTNAPTNGSAGGNTTFFDGTTTVTAFGGPISGGGSPALSTNASLPGSGQAGGLAINDVSGGVMSGFGGSSALGGAGGAAVGVAGIVVNGIAGRGPGAGGSGGAAPGGNSAAGGAGTAGIIILEEYA